MYALALTGAWLFLARGVSEPGVFPDLETGSRALLLAIPSLALLAMLAVSTLRLVSSYRSGVWGSRIGLRQIGRAHV